MRDAAAAVIFAIVYFGGIWLARNNGWYPNDDTLRKFNASGICTIAVLFTRERFPLSTLALVCLGYPMIYANEITSGAFPKRVDVGLRNEIHLLPILLAAFTVVAKGRLRTIWVLIPTVYAVSLLMVGLPSSWASLMELKNQFWWYKPDRILTAELVAVGGVLLGRASYLQKRTAAQLLARNHELQRLRGVETDQVVSAERTRIARELHDVVAHHISAVVIRAQAADRVADSRPEETREAVRWIAANGQETLAAMRHVVRVLRSSQTGGGLAPQATLAELPDIANRMTAVGLPVELRLPSIVPVLPAAVELATVRIIQEALTNVLVHANATQALVKLSVTDDELRLEVHDDGSAKLPPTGPIRLLTVAAAAAGATRPIEQKLPVSASALGGNGLIGMRERAASCGGNLLIGTSPLGGWLVAAVMPTSLIDQLNSPDAVRTEVPGEGAPAEGTVWEPARRAWQAGQSPQVTNAAESPWAARANK